VAAGLYYAIQVLAELTVVTGLLYSSVKYGTSAVELLAAIQTMVGGWVRAAVQAMSTHKHACIPVLAHTPLPPIGTRMLRV